RASPWSGRRPASRQPPWGPGSCRSLLLLLLRLGGFLVLQVAQVLDLVRPDRHAGRELDGSRSPINSEVVFQGGEEPFEPELAVRVRLRALQEQQVTCHGRKGNVLVQNYVPPVGDPNSEPGQGTAVDVHDAASHCPGRFQAYGQRLLPVRLDPLQLAQPRPRVEEQQRPWRALAQTLGREADGCQRAPPHVCVERR